MQLISAEILLVKLQCCFRTSSQISREIICNFLTSGSRIKKTKKKENIHENKKFSGVRA